MKIITGVERRRRRLPDQKLRILAELKEPGSTVAEVARRGRLRRDRRRRAAAVGGFAAQWQRDGAGRGQHRTSGFAGYQ